MASKGKKAGIIIGAVFGLAAIISSSVAIVKYVEKNQEQGSGTTIVTPTPDPTPNPNPNPNPNPTPDPTPDPGPIVKTEAEYKAMFEKDLPSVIENYFNENVSIHEVMNISNVEIAAINHETGNIYFNCVINNVNKFCVANSTDFSSSKTYQNAYENLKETKFTFGNAQSVQEKDLAEKIASYALEQDEVLEYLINNGISYSNCEVLNVSEFNSTTKGDLANLVLKMGDKIFSMTMGGTTGAYSTQEECLEILKGGRLSILTNFNIENYKELEVVSSAEASSQKTFVCTLPDDYNDLLKGNTFTTNFGDLQFV